MTNTRKLASRLDIDAGLRKLDLALIYSVFANSCRSIVRTQMHCKRERGFALVAGYANIYNTVQDK